MNTASADAAAPAPVPEVKGAAGTGSAGIVAVVAAPSVAPGTDAPLQSPAEWVLLAAARREIGESASVAGNLTAITTTATAAAASAQTPSPNVITTVVLPTDGSGYSSKPVSLAVSPDGRYVYTGNEDEVLASLGTYYGSVTKIDTATNKVTARWVVGFVVTGVTVAPNGLVYAVGSNISVTSSYLAIIDPTKSSSTKPTVVSNILSGPRSVAITPNGKTLVVGNIDGTVDFVDVATKKITGTVRIASASPVTDIAIAPDGKSAWIAATDYGRGTSLGVAQIDLTTGNRKSTNVPDFGGSRGNIVLSPDGTKAYAVVGSLSDSSNPIAVIDTTAGKVTRTLGGDFNGFWGVSFSDLAVSPDGKYLFAKWYSADAAENQLGVIDTASGRLVASMDAEGFGIAVRPDGNRVYLGSSSSYTNSRVNVVKVYPTDVFPAPKVTVSVGVPNAKSGVVSGKVTVTDPNATKLTFTVSGSTGGKVTITSAGAFTYTPSAAARHAASATTAVATKSDGFTVIVSGSPGGAVSVPVTVPITPKNTVPTVKSAPDSPNVDTGVVTGRMIGSDADGDALTYRAGTAPSKGSVVVKSDGTFAYTPTDAARYAAGAAKASATAKSDTFTVVVGDGHGGTATAAVTVKIAPGIPGLGVTVTRAVDAKTSVVTGKIAVNNPGTEKLSFKVADGRGAKVTIDSSGTFTYTPSAAQRKAATASSTGTFTVTITVGSHQAGKTITVPIDAGTPVALAPTVGTADADTGVITGKVKFSDPAGRKLTYIGSGFSAGGASVEINATTGAFTYTPTEAQRMAAPTAASNAVETITIGVSNGVHSTFTTIKVNITPITLAPTGQNLFANMDGADVLSAQLVRDKNGVKRMVVYMSGISLGNDKDVDAAFRAAAFGELNASVKSFIDARYDEWHPTEIMMVGLSGGALQLQNYAATSSHNDAVATLVLYGAPLSKTLEDLGVKGGSQKSVVDIVDNGDTLFKLWSQLAAWSSYDAAKDDKGALLWTDTKIPATPLGVVLGFGNHDGKTYAKAAALFDSKVKSARAGSEIALINKDIQRFAGEVLDQRQTTIKF